MSLNIGRMATQKPIENAMKEIKEWLQRLDHILNTTEYQETKEWAIRRIKALTEKLRIGDC